MSEVEAWHARTRTQATDRDMEIRDACFVKDQYGRRIARIVQPDVLVKEAQSSRTRFGGLQPAPLQLVRKYGGDIHDTTPDTVVHSHTSANEFSCTRFNDPELASLQLTENYGSGTITSTHTMTDSHPTASDVVGSRSDPVRLSRKTAVKRISTRGNNTMTEKRSTRMSSKCSLARDSSKNTTTRPIKELPLVSRRFSFDEDSELAFSTVDRRETLGLPNTRGRFPIRTSIHTSTVQPYKESASIARLLTLPLPPGKEPHDISLSSLDSHYHEFVNIDLCSWELSQDVAKKAGLQTMVQDVEVKRKRIPRTFDEILGEQKLPTALL
ncbi:hypothetical protein KJE20_11237 [Pyrenophora tritici-repentis]|uniref:Uncharacterized protein n=1 Tax=Pyrenophora tritici-repentis TaxID=45151 RepID=A0A922SUX5_9PLEO|nr:hypothetical protein Ptr86124_002619 [Pyrenophora tritici-repentis]KAI1679055.1 hypothetical protein KJE20_11237 [Pyrenophora tritici-repentis]